MLVDQSVALLGEKVLVAICIGSPGIKIDGYGGIVATHVIPGSDNPNTHIVKSPLRYRSIEDSNCKVRTPV